MTVENIIEKPETIVPRPNLRDYDETCRTFEWTSAYDRVEWDDCGRLNAAESAVDRHARSSRKHKVALYWQGADRDEKYTFLELSNLSNRFANVLTELGIEKRDRVFIFLPRIPELYVSFLGILKVGAIAGTMFSAFGPEGLYDRLHDSGARYLITNSSLKERVYEIRDDLPDLERIIITDEDDVAEDEVIYQESMKKASDTFDVARMLPDEPAFMLYTSGTTGKPKGVVHRHLAIVQQHLTTEWVLDLHDDDIYWCTADPGWVTGISYGILGPFSCGASVVVHDGRFDPDVWYSIVERYHVTVWYSAPTAFRMLARAGDVYKNHDLGSLRHICSVGEPLNAEIVHWGMRTFKLPIHDNFWQTETGGILIANYPSMPIKPGWMGKPIPGIIAAIIDDDGKEVSRGVEGNLALVPDFPSLMLDIWKNPAKYQEYFIDGWYLTGDRAVQHEDGYFLFIGRADDVINTSGERVGPFEVESALIEHPAIVEAGVIGKPDPLRGEIIKAFVVLGDGYEPSDELESDVKRFVKTRLAGHAYPREFEVVETLPKTRSGKIVRRMLRAKELGLPIGDVSTLE
jgi:acetyl-CoA synthetase